MWQKEFWHKVIFNKHPLEKKWFDDDFISSLSGLSLWWFLYKFIDLVFSSLLMFVCKKRSFFFFFFWKKNCTILKWPWRMHWECRSIYLFASAEFSAHFPQPKGLLSDISYQIDMCCKWWVNVINFFRESALGFFKCFQDHIVYWKCAKSKRENLIWLAEFVKEFSRLSLLKCLQMAWINRFLKTK